MFVLVFVCKMVLSYNYSMRYIYWMKCFYYSCFLCIFANQTKIEVIYE